MLNTWEDFKQAAIQDEHKLYRYKYNKKKYFYLCVWYGNTRHYLTSPWSQFILGHDATPLIPYWGSAAEVSGMNFLFTVDDDNKEEDCVRLSNVLTSCQWRPII